MTVFVAFKGRGEWFIKDEKGIRTVITKITPGASPFGGVHDYAVIRVGIEHRRCNEYSGAFCLTKEDEIHFQFNKSINDYVSRLLPCDHPDSSFKKMIQQGYVSENDWESCFFVIQKFSRDGFYSRRGSFEDRRNKKLFPVEPPPSLVVIEQLHQVTQPITKWNSLDRKLAIKFIRGMAEYKNLKEDFKCSEEKFADWIIGEMPNIQNLYQLEVDRQIIIDILTLDKDYSVDQLRAVMLAFAAVIFGYQGLDRSPLTTRGTSKKTGEVNKKSIVGNLRSVGVDVSHDFVRTHLKIAHESFKMADKAGKD